MAQPLQYNKLTSNNLTEGIMKTEKWQVWAHDVWGNDKDGYEVNDKHCIERGVEFEVKGEIFNPGTPQEFISFDPTKEQFFEWIKSEYSVELANLEFSGDDCQVYVEFKSDAYPICEFNRIEPEAYK